MIFEATAGCPRPLPRTSSTPPAGPPMDEDVDSLPLPEWKPGQPRSADWPPHIHPPRDVSVRE